MTDQESNVQNPDSRVVVFDTTLRDGEQSPGATLTASEKLEVADALVALKVDVIEAGFPAASPGDFEAVQAIAARAKGVTIAGLARATPAELWEIDDPTERAVPNVDLSFNRGLDWLDIFRVSIQPFAFGAALLLLAEILDRRGD